MAFGAFERMTALRYLGPRRREGFAFIVALFSMLGILSGVFALIATMSIMNGFREELLSKIVGLNGHAVVYPPRGAIALPDYDRVAAAAGLVEGVAAATPYVEGQVLASSSKNGSGALVRGLRPADLFARPVFAAPDVMVSGLLEDFGRRPGVFMGDKLANRLGVWLGDRVTLLSPRGRPTPFGDMPTSKSYEIVGVFNIGMFEFDSTIIFMPFDDAQAYLLLDGAATGVEVRVADPERIERYRAPLARAAGAEARVVDWKQSNRSLVSALMVERNVMFIILTLIICVAAFNIISGMVMMVKSKGRDIAILRTMGATRGAILRLFLITGSIIGVTGTAIGVGLSVLFVENIAAVQAAVEAVAGADLFSEEVRFFAQVPARLEWPVVGLVAGISLAISFLATVYPAWRAARLDPVEALRNE